MSGLIFLKLGGSLITDKRVAETPRLDVLTRLAQEIAHARADQPTLRLVIGHGSGSFGHVVGSRYGTRHGVTSAQGWYGFAATGDAAARLNRLVTAALLNAGIPAWSIQPGAVVRAVDGKVVTGPTETVALALDRGLVPVVYGDVVLDSVRGGTIASTEEIFEQLVQDLHPSRLILAGEVDGVFSADPQLDPTALAIPIITPGTLDAVRHQLGASHGVDVTGGMAAKVAQSVALAARHSDLTITLCSGLIPDHLRRILADPDALLGTRIRSEAVPKTI